MFSQEQQRVIANKSRTLQAISGAMILGAVMLAVSFSVIVNWEELGNPLKLITIMGGATGGLLILFAAAAPFLFSPSQSSGRVGFEASPQDEEAVAAQNQKLHKAIGGVFTEHLIRYALLEAAITLNLMALMLEPHYASLTVVAFGLALMLLLFPRAAKFESQITARI